jgi:predicted DNA-binding transcriptional regulator AlpA
MTLGEFVAALERRAAEAEREGATAPVANVYRLVLDELRPLAVTKGSATVSVPEPDRLLTVAEAAAILGVAPRWLYRHASRLPFARRLSPKALRFSEAALARYLERPR